MFFQCYAKVSDYRAVGLSNRQTLDTHPFYYNHVTKKYHLILQVWNVFMIVSSVIHGGKLLPDLGILFCRNKVYVSSVSVQKFFFGTRQKLHPRNFHRVLSPWLHSKEKLMTLVLINQKRHFEMVIILCTYMYVYVINYNPYNKIIIYTDFPLNSALKTSNTWQLIHFNQF